MSAHVGAVIPSFNEEGFIADTIRSIGRQRLSPDIQLSAVLVDRKGEDQTREVALNCAKEIGLPLEIVEDSECAMSGARRLGIKHLREAVNPTHFLSMDADTVLPESWLASALDYQAESGAALVAGEGFFATSFWLSVPRMARLYAQYVGRVFFPPEIYRLHRDDTPRFESLFRRFGRPPSDCAMLVDANAMIRTGDIPLDLDEDGNIEQGVGWPLMVRLAAAKEKFVSLESPRYQTSPRRFIAEASALLDSTAYRHGVSAHRTDKSNMRRLLDEHAAELDFSELVSYVIRNYVVLACLLRPELVDKNSDLFGCELAARLADRVNTMRLDTDMSDPRSVFRIARYVATDFEAPILFAFDRERA